jgi:hypothetical protein
VRMLEIHRSLLVTCFHFRPAARVARISEDTSMKVLHLATLSLSLAAVASPLHARALPPPQKQSNAGDSISQGMHSNGWLFDHPDLSFAQGTSQYVNSVFLRYQQLTPNFGQEPESVSGASFVGGGDNFAAQAARICRQEPRPERVTVLFGGNDVCNRKRSKSGDPTRKMYSVQTYVNGIRAGLDQLAECLPPGAHVAMLSAPRVDFLYEAGHEKGFWCPYILWPIAKVCRIVTAEKKESRRALIGKRIDEYNVALAQDVTAYNMNSNGKNSRGIYLSTDWRGSIDQGFSDTSVGTYHYSGAQVNSLDCFHPNTKSQQRLACLAWALQPEGNGPIEECAR